MNLWLWFVRFKTLFRLRPHTETLLEYLIIRNFHERIFAVLIFFRKSLFRGDNILKLHFTDFLHSKFFCFAKICSKLFQIIPSFAKFYLEKFKQKISLIFKIAKVSPNRCTNLRDKTTSAKIDEIFR